MIRNNRYRIRTGAECGLKSSKAWIFCIVIIATLGYKQHAHAQTTAVGSDFSLFLKNDGTVWACGNNWTGQMGIGVTCYSSFTTAIKVNITGVTAIAAGANHALFLKNDGTVWACGTNWAGQLGNGTTTDANTPTQISGLTGIVAIAAAGYHSLFLKNDGTAWSCGDNSVGQLGLGNIANTALPLQIGSISGITKIFTGQYRSAFIRNDGTAWTCGENNLGQLGNGTTTESNIPVHVASLTNVTAVACGLYHTVFLKTDGTAWTCGSNYAGAFGNGTTTPSTTVIAAAGAASDIRAVAAGNDYSLFLKNDGTVWGSGLNNVGQLANGTFNPTATPVQATGIASITAISAGSHTSFFTRNDGIVFGSGMNTNGILGNVSTASTNTPVQVSTIAAGAAYATGIAATGMSSLFLENNGSVWACGYGITGALGIGANGHFNKPVQAASITNVSAIKGTGGYSLFLKNDGTAWASGRNADGQFGNGTFDDSNVPVLASGLTGISAIAAGYSHAVFLKNDGTVWSSGTNANGELGDGTNTAQNTPVQASGLTNITAVAAGSLHSLFLKNDGTVWACGYNMFGQLGNGNNTDQNTPVQVSGLTDITAIATGDMYSLFLKNDGTVWACGQNSFGKLGDGTTTSRNAPVQVGISGNVTAIAAGAYHSLFLLSDGTVWGCGANSSGQMGGNFSGNILIPASIAGLAGITAISAGSYHSLFLKNDGAVVGIGGNFNGALGVGSPDNSIYPIPVGLPFLLRHLDLIGVLPISGASQVCVQQSIPLTNAVAGGVWSSSNASVAEVSASGMTTGIGAGIAVISYTTADGTATISVTVNANTPITGAATVVFGQTITLSNQTPGGQWSTNTPWRATVVPSTGLVKGISAGMSVVTYTNGAGCSSTHTVTVLSGVNACVGQTITISDGGTGGVWSSNNGSIAAVGSSTGVITGVGVGKAIITHRPAAGGVITTTVTVNALAPINASSLSVCQQQAITLTNGTAGGGNWYSANTNIATVATNGTVTGVNGGMAVIHFAPHSGCATSKTITIQPVAPITGNTSVCTGQTTALSVTTGGGNWSSSSGALANVSTTGVVTGVAAGMPRISYIWPATGCFSTTTVTVRPIMATTGVNTICRNQSATLTNNTPGGGAWITSNPGIAMVTGGVVTGMSAGSSTITFNASNGCSTTKAITVNQTPDISGTTSVCVGQTTALSNSLSGGNWSSSSAALAQVSAAGVVSGVAAGTPRISYIMAATGCYATTNVVLRALSPVTGGTAGICASSSMTLANTTPGGGIWSSSNSSAATVHPNSGFVKGVAPGNTVVSFTAANGCVATRNVTVNACREGSAISETSEITPDDYVSVFPNPNNGQFTLSGRLGSTADGSMTVEIANMTGQLIYSHEAQQQNGIINIPIALPGNIPPGIYLLLLHCAKEKKILRILVQ